MQEIAALSTSNNNKTKVGVLISGRGSNMVSLAQACQDATFPAEIAVVISDKPDAKGLEKATEMGIKAVAVPKKGKTKQEFENEIHQALIDAGVEIICLAGFMRIISAEFIEKWHNKILNIHPSLLPSFKGLNVQQQALDAGVKFAGCTVHFVVPAVDAGAIIEQAVVPVLPDDDADTLAARILVEEHKIYPAALKTVIEKM
ncbi:MAG: phosphoribosylglycinamide formyltransferase [Alphaproteobacteria bacterium]|nr:phosphoribosylglycinamide formyltransferase [Alphaproteobacteria bacterium]